MLAALPLLVFAWCAFLVRATRPISAREAILIAWTIVWAWLVVGTEVFSLVRVLTPAAVFLWWLIPCVVLTPSVIRRARRSFELGGRWSTMDRASRVMAAGAASLGAMALIVAVLAAPATIDVMTYHIPRQLFWAQQHAVAHYATNDLRELMMPPLAEYAGLHLMLLSGGDRCANLVQWSAYAVSMSSASLVARSIGASVRGQTLAAFLAVASPTLYMQATCAKNDLVLGSHILSLAYWTIELVVHRRRGADVAAGIGAAAGLCLLTKGTAAMFIVPFIPVVATGYWRLERWRCAIPGLSIVLVVLGLNVGHASRNIDAFGSITGPDAPAVGGYGLLNERMDAGALASNLARNVALHLGTPWPAANAGLENAVERVHIALGLDDSDPATTTYGSFRIDDGLRNEATAASGPHAVLFVLVSLAWWRCWRRGGWILVAAVAGGFVLLCVALKWQPWHARLHAPLVCLACPLLGATLGTRWATACVAGSFAGAATLVTAFLNVQRPLATRASVLSTDREAAFFTSQARHAEAERCVEFVRLLRPRIIAVWPSDPHTEYPLQRLLLERCSPRPEFVVFNPRFGGPAPPAPDVLILFNDQAPTMTYAPTGAWLPCVYTGLAHVVCVSEAIVTRDGLTPIPRRFTGFEVIRGLAEPTPGDVEAQRPTTRRGVWPSTELEVRSPGGMLRLSARCRRIGANRVTVRIDGEVCAVLDLTGREAIRDVTLEFEADAGVRRIVLEYHGPNPGSGAPVAFERLNVVPVAMPMAPAVP